MKYDSYLTNVQNLLPQAKNILIVLPSQANLDELAAGLALLLPLENSGKNVSIATESVIKVEHSHLFGIDKVRNNIPDGVGGNPYVVLEGVASNGTVPSLEKLDWRTEGPDLHLIFVTLPGQKFEPRSVSSIHYSGNFDLVFTIGAQSLESLGSIYANKKDVFQSTHIVNIDSKSNNNQFGSTNIVDPSASSNSEIVFQLLQPLKLPIDGDISTNILVGIFFATSNLQGANVGADTFEVVASALRSGGRKPAPSAETPKQEFDFSQFLTPQPTQSFNFQPQQQPVSQNQPIVLPNQPVFDPEAQTRRAVTPGSLNKEQQPEIPQSSPEETPAGEQAQTTTPEADWLTPKIFKGSSVG